MSTQFPHYPVICYAPGCSHEAQFKIAATWSDGITRELKTYFLACPRCVPDLYRSAAIKKNACRLAAGESLGDPQVFEIRRGARDRELVRRPDLEHDRAN